MNRNQKIARDTLFSKGINPSYYRIVILENILKNPRKCLKANELYSSIHRNAPTISKATLYNNLLLFEENAIVDKISFGQDDVRYCLNDGKFYIYFRCKQCQKMYRLESSWFSADGGMIDGHKIERMHIMAYGVCKKCLQSELGGRYEKVQM